MNKIANILTCFAIITLLIGTSLYRTGTEQLEEYKNIYKMMTFEILENESTGELYTEYQFNDETRTDGINQEKLAELKVQGVKSFDGFIEAYEGTDGIYVTHIFVLNEQSFMKMIHLGKLLTFLSETTFVVLLMRTIDKISSKKASCKQQIA